MLQLITTKQFERDVKLAQKRGNNMQKLRDVMQKLINEERLPAINRDHPLMGNYACRRECHIEPDWLLIYKLEETSIIFERAGTHSDLFK